MPHTKNRLEISVAYLHWKDKSTLHVHFKKDSVIGLAEQQELFIAHNKFTADIPHCVLYTADEFVNITPEARKKARELETNDSHLASAVVTKNLAYKIIVNFYVRFNKPGKPFKCFSFEEDAMAWLRSFIHQPVDGRRA